MRICGRAGVSKTKSDVHGGEQKIHRRLSYARRGQKEMREEGLNGTASGTIGRAVGANSSPSVRFWSKVESQAPGRLGQFPLEERIRSHRDRKKRDVPFHELHGVVRRSRKTLRGNGGKAKRSET